MSSLLGGDTSGGAGGNMVDVATQMVAELEREEFERAKRMRFGRRRVRKHGV